VDFTVLVIAEIRSYVESGLAPESAEEGKETLVHLFKILMKGL
jgi:hypothetical protein